MKRKSLDRLLPEEAERSEDRSLKRSRHALQDSQSDGLEGIYASPASSVSIGTAPIDSIQSTRLTLSSYQASSSHEDEQSIDGPNEVVKRPVDRPLKLRAAGGERVSKPRQRKKKKFKIVIYSDDPKATKLAVLEERNAARLAKAAANAIANQSQAHDTNSKVCRDVLTCCDFNLPENAHAQIPDKRRRLPLPSNSFQ